MSTDQSAPKTVDAYIAAFPAEVQAILEQIRQLIHETIPGLGETISYGMPTFTLSGKYLVYIAAHKKHIGLYPAPTGVEEFHEAVALYGGGKGTLFLFVADGIDSALAQAQAAAGEKAICVAE